MNFEILAHIFETLGSLMVGFAALRVHHRVLNEHKIDGYVFKVMKAEQIVGVVGMMFILLSFIIKISI